MIEAKKLSMSDSENSDDGQINQIDDNRENLAKPREDVELLNPNLMEDDETEYEEVDDEEPELRKAQAKPLNDEEEDGDDDDDDVAVPQIEGSYDPSDFDNLDVDDETKDLFGFIMKYTPQTVELDHKFKPFIPDYIPAVGDIDAFIRCTRPDARAETLGLTVLDEPSAKQSDPSVLELHMRVVTKQTSSGTRSRVKRVQGQDVTSLEKWIHDISDLHRSKPAPTIHYSKTMPDIDNLMQEWPEDMEETLKATSLPLSDLSADLSTQVDLVCSLLDIPRYKSRIQSLHVLFTLYSAFKQSQHFNQFNEEAI